MDLASTMYQVVYKFLLKKAGTRTQGHCDLVQHPQKKSFTSLVSKQISYKTFKLNMGVPGPRQFHELPLYIRNTNPYVYPLLPFIIH